MATEWGSGLSASKCDLQFGHWNDWWRTTGCRGGTSLVEFDVFQWISKTCYEPKLSVRNCHHLARSTSSSYLFVSKFRVDKICTVNDPRCIRRQSVMSTWAKGHATSSPASPNFLFNKFLSNHRISQFQTLGVTENGAGYELGALGVPLDRAERRFVHDASKPSCAVCLAAQRVSAERLLMAGAWKTVVLAPQHGEVPMGVWMPYMQVFF